MGQLVGQLGRQLVGQLVIANRLNKNEVILTKLGSMQRQYVQLKLNLLYLGACFIT